MHLNRIGGVVVSVLAMRVQYIVGLSPNRVKPKTMKLVFVASLLSMQHLGVRTKTGYLGMRIKYLSEETCLAADCCFSKLAL